MKFGYRLAHRLEDFQGKADAVLVAAAHSSSRDCVRNGDEWLIR